MPNSKPMPDIGPGCHELRINDKTVTWWIIYRIDADLILILEVFEKKSQKTPKRVIEICSQRAKRFDSDCE